MTEPTNPARYYWTRHTDGAGRWHLTGPGQGMPPGADLAKLKRGLGRRAGEVPEMWRFYTTLNHEGDETSQFVAEHHALTLFALHQQSQARPMHREGIGLGTAVRNLRSEHAGDDDPIDRRLGAAATATSRTELVLHLRGLITLLRGINRPLDYTLLYKQILTWDRPEMAARTRRRWGSEYFVGHAGGKPSAASSRREG
ncbi:type I-E CRISPR-associated protein Cse2/CasB [Actinoplanes sp. NBRC 101535]|uniref:type I-E CRISPR-associated protein Cse2/CasB n=1 Tax=Actinoplanes sp. NBRC 101535 TaxID=3032196 RepID=UPI0024A4743C|nr:type I-E CRISPR-associated protein Cse2/CasB [Actinoplanes sp. NBRC 101535]GLY03972.1 hypothetical protein Acsp01_43510 [Actinoplanes sp. NBRC 101535]